MIYHYLSSAEYERRIAERVGKEMRRRVWEKLLGGEEAS